MPEIPLEYTNRPNLAHSVKRNMKKVRKIIFFKLQLQCNSLFDKLSILAYFSSDMVELLILAQNILSVSVHSDNHYPLSVYTLLALLI